MFAGGDEGTCGLAQLRGSPDVFLIVFGETMELCQKEKFIEGLVFSLD